MPSLPVVESFLSFQGEGDSVGKLAYFIRLAGCNLNCTWCFGGATRILMRDLTWKSIGDIKEGEVVMGVDHRGGVSRLTPSTVLNTMERRRKALHIEHPGGAFYSTSDHPFYATYGSKDGNSFWRSEYIQLKNCLHGNKRFSTLPWNGGERSTLWLQGWMAGMVLGDGCFHEFRGRWMRFKLVQKCSHEYLINQFIANAEKLGYHFRKVTHMSMDPRGKRIFAPAAELTNDQQCRELQRFWSLDKVRTEYVAATFRKGFLAGLFDSEGSIKTGSGDVRISQKEREILDVAQSFLGNEGIPSYIRKDAIYSLVIPNKLRFLLTTLPYKVDLQDTLKMHPLQSGEPVSNNQLQIINSAVDTDVYDLTTTSHNFIAEGFIVHNCDSTYASRATAPATDVNHIVTGLVKQTGMPITVITGGEPMLYQDGILELIKLIPLHVVQIETNGTIEPSGEFRGAVPQFNVSPKLPSSGNIAEHAIRTGILSIYAHECNSIFKFVIKDFIDWAAMEEILQDIEIPSHRVWIMPEGRTPTEIRKRTLELVPVVKDAGYNLSPRFHVMIWGKKRGV